jgi:hypothetical protein
MVAVSNGAIAILGSSASAAGGHLACVETLLEARALVDATIVVGRTALHLAARMNHPEIVRRLLDAGADRSIRCKVGKTALDEARQKGHAAVVAILDPTSTPVPPPVPPPVLPAASPALPPSATKRNRSALEALSDLFSPVRPDRTPRSVRQRTDGGNSRIQASGTPAASSTPAAAAAAAAATAAAAAAATAATATASSTPAAEATAVADGVALTPTPMPSPRRPSRQAASGPLA